ncbi:MAG: BON domain-containing protein [Planctomycetota bacterium]|jgi:osmotically-inducible protein OsmY
MRRSIPVALILLFACGTGYRSSDDSEPMRLEIEDSNIASRVRVALARDAETAPYTSIKVDCAKGVVTLVGEVDRQRIRVRAVEIAEVCEGVLSVNDRITVASSSG